MAEESTLVFKDFIHAVQSKDLTKIRQCLAIKEISEHATKAGAKPEAHPKFEGINFILREAIETGEINSVSCLLTYPNIRKNIHASDNSGRDAAIRLACQKNSPSITLYLACIYKQDGKHLTNQIKQHNHFIQEYLQKAGKIKKQLNTFLEKKLPTSLKDILAEFDGNVLVTRKNHPRLKV